MNIYKSILLLAAVTTSLVSCVVADYPGGPAVSTAPASFGVYDTLPDAYVGDAYFYRNRYYYGGIYQRGHYNYQGRQYNDRYYHNGQYFYGGRNESHTNRVNRSPDRSEKRDYRSDDRGRSDDGYHDRR